jgi:small subunit ribosomal protein S1
MPKKKKDEKVEEKKDKHPQTMEELLAQTDEKIGGLKRKEFVTGTVADKRKNTIYFDISAKTEGIVTGKELKRVQDFADQLKIGDEVEVQVRVPENDRGQTLLSLRKAAGDYAWNFFREKKETGETLEVYGKEESHGGLVVKAPFGRLGFVPGSQIGEKYDQDPRNMVGKDIEVKVLEVKRDQNRLVFSERLVSEPEVVEEEKELIDSIGEGDKFKAKVVRVEPFGLFVEIKKDDTTLEGLVHISEISWEKVNNLQEKYSAGDEVEVVLLNKKGDRLQFSVKRLKPDPWEGIEGKYPEEEQFKGEIVRLASFGALVQLEPGIEGLIHISKIPPDVDLEVGQEVQCYVESLDKENRRLSLGLVLTGEKIPIYK